MTACFCRTAVVLVGLSVLSTPPAQAQDGGRVLVYSRTAGFRHASISDGLDAFRALGSAHGFSVTATESPTAFTETALAGYDAVVFLNTTGDVLDAGQQAALEGYVRAGGGFVGVHAAADTEYDWPWYGGLVGAYFESHPAGTPGATVHVVDRVHPASAGLPATWARTDEWYNYRTNPRGAVHVLATLDETTYTGGTMGGDHPIAWCRPYDGGRSFYTGGGHTAESFGDARFRDHLWGGLAWAAGWAPGDCSATVETGWERTVLDADVQDPMELAVAPDGRVFFVERGGAVKVWDPARAQTVVAARLAVTTSYEDGLLGIALDPDFERTGWVYLYYSAAGAEPVQRLARFTAAGNTLDLASEAVLLTVRTDRDQGGHSGGSLAFGPDGLLYVATGDDTDPFESAGYAPLDERAGRASWDAQRTSGNPFDLRGKVLRVRPLPDGTAEIPAGNLFPADGLQGRPEVFAMGVRNPFRLAVDPETGWLYWGDVGPDATDASSARGPRGYDEVNQARAAGFFGWPYCTADNQPYRDFDFATNASGPAFDCAAVTNASPNVPQAPLVLPPARPAWAWYPYATSPEFPDLPDGGGRTVMAGPVVRRSALRPDASLPAYFDGSVFVYEWSRNWIVETHLDEAGGPLAFQRFLPHLELHRPMDLELGADGALYMLEWGAGYGGNNPDAALSRIAYVRGALGPVASVQASPSSGPVPLVVTFTSTGTAHPDGLPLDYAWDLDGDGTTDATTPSATWTYTARGAALARLTVTDPNGRTATATATIVAGNSEPVVSVAMPVDGGFFAWGDSLRYDVSVADAEDGNTAAGTLDCARVVVQPGVGHDDHNHPLEEYAGCTGGFRAPAGHGADAENVFVVVEARYADAGAEGVGSLTGRRQIVLRPKRLEAEHFADASGAGTAATGDGVGGEDVVFSQNGSWVAYQPVNLLGVPSVSFRVAAAVAGGRLEARLDAPTGSLVASSVIPATGGLQSYRDLTVSVADPGGTHTLYLVYQNPAGGRVHLNWVQFHGPGTAVPPARPRGLAGEYYASPDLTGEALLRTDPQVSFDWGVGAPFDGLPTNGFSVRWTGRLRVPESGTYRFTTATDDGARLYVGGDLVVDAWGETGFRQKSGSATLAAGEVDLRLEYQDLSRAAQAALLWSGPGVAFQTVPEDRLFTSAAALTSSATLPAGPGGLRLDPPRPNPGRGATQIAFSLSEPGDATVVLFDALGRRVAVAFEGYADSGAQTIRADLSGLPSGVYVVRLTTRAGSRAQMLTVVR